MKPAVKWSINIDSPQINPESDCYYLDTWPPSDNFPVVLDDTGKTISRFGDSEWILTSWTTCSTILNFGDGKVMRGIKNTSENAIHYRILMAWWIWKSPTAVSVSTVKTYHSALSVPFRICSDNNISITELSKHPKVSSQITNSVKSSTVERLIILFHIIYENRNEIGFHILSPTEIDALHAYANRSERQQTPYVPPRIWSYQVKRLSEFIADFLKIKNNVETCFQHCITAYIKYYGSPENVFRAGGCNRRFSRIVGISFEELADSFGISGTLKKWLVAPGESLSGHSKGITLLSNYLTMTSRVGIAYILNFTAMRVNEAWNLKCNCLRREEDPIFGVFWTITGETTKLYVDDDARWVTSPSVAHAIEAMTVVSRLRLSAAKINPSTPTTEEESKNPYLVYRAYEPWATRINQHLPTYVRPQYASYASTISDYLLLLTDEDIKIKKEDMDIARLITPTLNSNKFAIGKTWPFSWHQMRRTGAVNMQASGLVSELSLQYDLKHQSRIQTLYYAQGFSKLLFNEDARSEYVKALYDTRAIKASLLLTNRFSSPHGEKRKAAMLAPYSDKDLKSLRDSASNGELPYKEVTLGVCLNKQDCQYGGIDNIIHCGGGDDSGQCAELLYDDTKLIPIKELRAEIILRQSSANPSSPYFDALTAQRRSAENVIAGITKNLEHKYGSGN